MNSIVSRLSNAHPASAWLAGIYSICSAHPVVLEETLRMTKGNKTLAARILGIDPTTVFRKLKAGEAEKSGGDERGGPGKAGGG